MLEWLSNPQMWAALITLTVLEIVLGIDNIIFISIISGRLPVEQQPKARRYGLAMAMITRCLLLLGLNWMAGLTTKFLHIGQHGFSGRDLILLFGGLFLIYKSTHEIHEKVEGDEAEALAEEAKASSFWKVIVTIGVLDIVFSLDSVITAVGMVDQVPIMIAAIIIAVGTMMLAAESISAFVEAHPSVKMLALSFLLVIGVVLMADAFGHHVPKGYIYSAMAFSVLVEMLNLRMRSRAAARVEPVKLHEPYVREGSPR